MRNLLRKVVLTASLAGFVVAPTYASITEQTIYINFDDLPGISGGNDYTFGVGSPPQQYYQNLFFGGHAGVTLTSSGGNFPTTVDLSSAQGAPSTATPNNGPVALSFLTDLTFTAVPNLSGSPATVLIAGIEFWYYQGSGLATVTGLNAGGTNVQFAGCPDNIVTWCDSGSSNLNVGTFETIGSYSGVRTVKLSGATGTVDAVTLRLVYDSGDGGGGGGGGGGLPEPGSIMLVTAALGGAFVFTRRKKVGSYR